jgi:tetratricopeptide (TPR) repeat protein
VALYDRGEAYQHKQEYAEAVADFSAVIKQEPDNPEAYARRSESSLALGNYEAATQDCEQLTLLKPNSAALWAACGRIAFMAGRFDQAASHFRRALQFGGRDRNASYDLLWLGLAGLKSGSMENLSMPQSILAFRDLSSGLKLLEISDWHENMAGLAVVSKRSDGTPATYHFPFQTLSFSGVAVANPDILIMRPLGTGDVGSSEVPFAIGQDVLRQLHLYVAYRERALYATSAEAN